MRITKKTIKESIKKINELNNVENDSIENLKNLDNLTKQAEKVKKELGNVVGDDTAKEIVGDVIKTNTKKIKEVIKIKNIK